MGAAAVPIGIALTALSTGVAVYSSVQTAEAQKQQAAYQASVNKNNSIIAQRAADDARIRGEEEVRKARKQAAALASRQRVALAGAGIDVAGGSALDLMEDTISMGEADALTIRGNAEREALGFEAQSAGFVNAAAFNLASGNSSGLAIAGTALTGASSVGTRKNESSKERDR